MNKVLFWYNKFSLSCYKISLTQFYPALPIGNVNLIRDHQKISYKRCDYESVDEKSLSYAMSRKTTKKEFGTQKG